MSESPVRTVFGWLLTLLGGLWLVLAGGCTLVFVAGDASGAALYLGIGAVCVAPGAVMLWLGLKMGKNPSPAESPRPVEITTTLD